MRIYRRNQENERKVSKTEFMELIRKHKGFVWMLVNRYAGKKRYSLSEEERLRLFQGGCFGLKRAWEKFKVSCEVNFSTYAAYWIKQGIQRIADAEGGSFYIPAYRIEFFRKVERIKASLRQKYQREPSASEIAKILNLPKKEIEEGLEYGRPRMVYLDEDAADGGAEEISGPQPYELIEDPDWKKEEERLERESSRDLVVGLLDGMILKSHIKKTQLDLSITSRDREIFVMYYGLDGYSGNGNCRLREIGKKFGISHERVRQILEMVIRKLRCRMLCEIGAGRAKFE